MARASRDFTTYQGWLFVGGSVAYVMAILAAVGLTASLSVVDDSRTRKERAQLEEPRVPSDLARVPEVVLEQMPANAQVSKPQISQLVAKIRNQEMHDPDGFVKGLIKERPDMQGLPFQMGHACRMDNMTSNLFGTAVAVTRESLRAEDTTVLSEVDPANRFFKQWGGQDTAVGVAALTQIFGPEKQSRREGLAKELGTIDHPATTKALAKTAVYDFRPYVRVAAVKGLKGRTKQDYTPILLAGLHHPWPQVVKNASNAIASLDRQDLVPQLVAFLAEADPRDPFAKEVDGKQCTVVNEMVKINHHRNCLLCHSPAPANAMQGGVFAVVPTPGVAFPSPDSGNPYMGSPGDAMIRADVTYLRQDFSVLSQVANANPWPDMQRFDFLVRTRVLAPEEIAQHAEQKKARAADQVSENHKAVAAALERLTGKENVAPTAVAWAAALDLALPQVAKQ